MLTRSQEDPHQREHQTDSKASVYCFGPFRLDPRERELTRGGARIPLTPKVFDTLAILVRQHGHLVEKTELMQQVWADAVVEQANLTVSVSALRKALGPGYIETVPKAGYRFLAPVTQLPSAHDNRPTAEHAAMKSEQSAGWGPTASDRTPAPVRRIAIWIGAITAAAAAIAAILVFGGDSVGSKRNPTVAPSIQSIAVLPLANLSHDPEQDYFADGMTEALISDLSKIRALRVISRTSAMRYKNTKKSVREIANELNVEGIVEGAVVRAGDRIRITADLVEAATDRRLWGETYERDLKEVLALQAEVARDIAEQVRTVVTPQERDRLARFPQVNSAAYQVYLKGRYYWNRRDEESVWKAIELFQQAIAIDPEYAAAWAGIADGYVVLGFQANVPPVDAVSRAKPAVMKALQIDDGLAEAHAVLAQLTVWDWDWPAAEREYRRAIELDPNYATAHHYYGLFLARRGRHDEAVAEVRRALQLDPVSWIIHGAAGYVLYLARRYDDALAQFRNMLELDPNRGTVYNALPLMQLHRYDEAIAELRRGLQTEGARRNEASAFLGYAYGKAGRRAEARKVLAEMLAQAERGYIPPQEIALVHIGLGENDKAMQWLTRAYDERSTRLVNLAADPLYDPLRSNVRFQDLQKRIQPVSRSPRGPQ